MSRGTFVEYYFYEEYKEKIFDSCALVSVTSDVNNDGGYEKLRGQTGDCYSFFL